MARAARLSILVLAFAFGLPLAAPATDSPQFRGPQRNGVFDAESLLSAWPEGGPRELWTFEGLGEGFASVSVADGLIYTTGMQNQRGTVYALGLDGKLKWKYEYGAEHSGNGYPGTRTTPTIDGGRLYLMSSMGKAVVLEAKTGKLVWEVDLLARFKGENLYFGMAESPLLVDGKVIFTPGGPDAAVVALDKETGETVWTSKGLSEKSAYCSPRLYENGDLRQIITFVEKHLVGINPENGTVLWRHPYEVNYGIHAVSPVWNGRKIYVSHGYKQGGRLFELAADGRSVKELWKEDKLDVQLGGALFLDGRIYGTADNKTWYVLDGESGAILASIPRLGKGAIVYADGLIYGYSEAGDVFLVNPDPENFKTVGRFKIEQGSGQHWAHPVVSGGLLYVRHGEALMAFDVADRGGEKSAAATTK